MADETATGAGAHESEVTDIKGKGKAVAEPGHDQSMDEDDSSSEEEQGEDQHGEEEEEDEDNMEEITTDNIVSGRTRGKNIDWQQAESKLSGELDDDEDDEDDEDFVAKDDEDAMQE